MQEERYSDRVANKIGNGLTGDHFDAFVSYHFPDPEITPPYLIAARVTPLLQALAGQGLLADLLPAGQRPALSVEMAAKLRGYAYEHSLGHEAQRLLLHNQFIQITREFITQGEDIIRALSVRSLAPAELAMTVHHLVEDRVGLEIQEPFDYIK